MTEPERSPITMFGRAREEAPALEWSWAVERLERAEDYWLVTVGSGGRPAARPVWGLWMDDRLYLTLGSSTHHRNLEARDEVTVHLGDAHDVVIVEGRATFLHDRPTLERLVERYNPKYRWDFTADTTGAVLDVAPRAVLAWIAAPTSEAKASAFPMAGSRWTPPAER
jgi:general stress protein 26